jgi:hypothetical protein
MSKPHYNLADKSAEAGIYFVLRNAFDLLWDKKYSYVDLYASWKLKKEKKLKSFYRQ